MNTRLTSSSEGAARFLVILENSDGADAVGWIRDRGWFPFDRDKGFGALGLDPFFLSWFSLGTVWLQ